MTLTVFKSASVGISCMGTHGVKPAGLLTRAGFHRYFRDRLTGFACDREDLVNWERLHLFTDCRLTLAAAAVREAYAPRPA